MRSFLFSFLSSFSFAFSSMLSVRLVATKPEMTTAVENWAEQVRAGDMRAISRAISAIENHEPEAEEMLRTLVSAHGQGVSRRDHRRAGNWQEHAGRPAGGALSRREERRGHHRGRSDESVHRRRDSGRPHPHAGTCGGQRSLHPLDGHARISRRSGAGHARYRRCCSTRPAKT